MAGTPCKNPTYTSTMFVVFANRSSLRLFGVWAAFLFSGAILLGAMERTNKDTVLCMNNGTVVVYSPPQRLVLGPGTVLHNTIARIHIHAEYLTQ